jgi:RNA 3'-terminal phosphate cyclase (ATP)
LLPMALGAGGSFVTGPITGHTETNIETIGRFVDVPITVEKLPGRRNRIIVAA